MRKSSFRIAAFVRRIGVVAVVVAIVGVSKIGASPASAGERDPAGQSLDATDAKNTADSGRLPDPVSAADVQAFRAVGDTAGVVTLPGDRVYGNEIDPITTVYLPNRAEPPPSCAGPVFQRIADDLELASGSCLITGYSLAVAGRNECGSPTFDVHVELWNGDPCEAASTVIEGTQEDILNVPNDLQIKLLSVLIDQPEPPEPPILIPDTVWMAVTFSTDDSGWVVAEKAEVGNTGDLWSENDDEFGCGQFVFNSGKWGGFWANLHCDLPEPPLGACCDEDVCTQTTEAGCTIGTWQGAFTTCEPNVCLRGACCRGAEFMDCLNTSEAECEDSLFHPNATCDVDTCEPTFKVFENDFVTGWWTRIETDTKVADDLTFGPGAPCNLIAYDLIAFGGENPDPELGEESPPTFNARLELWSNDDQETPNDPSDDVPFEVIAGTERDFSGIPNDLFPHALLAGPFPQDQDATVLVDRVWIVMTTDWHYSGPGLGGMADIGLSRDLFSGYNTPLAPDAWYADLWFEGFDPTGCPGPAPCTPAGSFRVRVWCAGDPPTGACCDRMSGTCTDDVRPADCAGRWVQDGTCENPNTFIPPCGAHACCHRFPLNPDHIICADYTEQECADAPRGPGRLIRGSFCTEDEVDCPAADCFDHTEDCYLPHESVGCEDPFCTELVCAQDSFCCGCTLGYCTESPQDACCCEEEAPAATWDQDCADLAAALCPSLFPNDVCEDAHAIHSTGTAPLTVEFDNSSAGRDGPAHEACLASQENQIDHDVWYTWESPCSETVYVSTCGQTTVDTRIAVYEGTSCPPTDENLLDCVDDLFCPLQSMAIFDATLGQEYLIRLGTFPGEPGGTGTFTVTCGPPNHPACPNGLVDCCAGEFGSGQAGCADETCCEAVCSCDSYCCNTEWDADCSETGFGGSGCGAEILCRDMCVNCPVGALNWIDPPADVVDARRPHAPDSATPLEGITTFNVLGPQGVDQDCWVLCETGNTGTPNEIVDISEVAGNYTITLDRPITPGEVTTISYNDVEGGLTTGVFTSHPGNTNGADDAGPTDVSDLVDALDNPGLLPWELFSKDMDRSGVVTPLDILTAVNLLNGADAYEAWNGTPLPVPGRDCP